MGQVAKIFQTGGSQAVRLPAEFRFAESEVFISRTAAGDVVLSSRPRASYADFAALRNKLGAEETRDFLRDRNQAKSEPRDPFASTMMRRSKK
jgi:antitoxin VapB